MGTSMGLALGGMERGFPVLLLILAVCFGVGSGNDGVSTSFNASSILIMTSEGNTFQLCVDIADGALVSGETLSIGFTIQAGFTGDVINLPPSNFEFNNITSSDCNSFVAIDDDISEETENFTITLMPTMGVEFVNDTATILITDNDVLLVAFNSSLFMTSEGDGVFLVCIEIINGIIQTGLNVSIGYTLQDGATGDINNSSSSDMFVLNSFTNSDCISLGIIDDNIIESTENFNITLLQGNIEVQFVNETATIVITDNDIPLVAFNSSTILVNEGDGSFQVCITIVNQIFDVGQYVSVAFTFQLGINSDLSFTSFDLNSSVSSDCITLGINDDDIVESTATSTIMLVQRNTEVQFVNGTATIVVIDNDSVTVAINPMFSRSLVEGNSGSFMNGTICVFLADIPSGGLQRDVVVNVTTLDGTATREMDYEFVDILLTFPSGSLVMQQMCFAIIITGDDVIDSTENFMVIFNLVTPDIFQGDSNVTITILDDRDIILVAPNMTTIIVSEGVGTVQVCLNIVRGIINDGQTLFVAHALQTGGNIDFVVSSIEFTSSKTFDCFPIDINDDDVIEEREIFTIKLFPGSMEVEFTNDTVTIVINDDDFATVGISQSLDRPLVEGNVGTSNSESICVTLLQLTSGGLDRDIVVDVMTMDETATRGRDYEFERTSLTFPSGSTVTQQKCVIVNITGDDVIDGNETFMVMFTLATPDIFQGGSNVIITILDDGDTLLVTFNSPTITTTEGDGNFQVCIEIVDGNIDIGQSVSITYILQNGSENDINMATSSNMFELNSYARTNCILLDIIDDNITEGTESFTITLVQGSMEVVFADPTATIVITDDDVLLVGFNQSIIPTREGDGNFTIRVEVVTGTIATGLNISFEYILQNGTTDDITTSPSNIIEFTSSKPFEYISFEVNDDDIIESTESYTVTLVQGSLQVEFVNATATIVITDNDNATLQVDQMLERSLVEGNYNSSNAESICVTLIEVTSGGLDRDIIVDVTTLDETATRGSDYVLDGTSLTFPSTSLVMQELCISVNITEDVLTEANETFIVILSPGTQDIFQGGSNVTITIIDDDILRVAFNSSIIMTREGNDSFQVCIDVVDGVIDVGLTVSIGYTLQNGTNSDIETNTSLTMFGLISSTNSDCISFGIIDDDIIESTENFTITLVQGNVEVEFVSETATILVIDNDNATLQVDQMLERSLVEGNFNSSNAESICVTLIEVTSGGLDRDIIVDVTTLDETATRGRDYVLDDTTLTFPSTSLVMQELCISVNITEDVLTETNETFTVIFTPGTQDIFQGGSNVTITIIDDDILRVAFNSSIIMTREGNDSFQVCIDVVDGAIDVGLTISIGYTLQNGTNSDIETNTSSTMFGLISSTNSDCISFGIIDDDIIESTENFNITLVQGNVEVEFVSETATILIIDNDSATVGINQPLDRSLVEGASGSLTTATICVTLINILPGGLVRDIIVDVTVSDGTATGGTDYMFDGTSLTFTSVSTMNQEVCISVNITGDALTEENEYFTVVFTLATPDIFQGGSIVTIVIIDDDTLPPIVQQNLISVMLEGFTPQTFGEANRTSFINLVVEAVNIYCSNNGLDGCEFLDISATKKNNNVTSDGIIITNTATAASGNAIQFNLHVLDGGNAVLREDQLRAALNARRTALETAGFQATFTPRNQITTQPPPDSLTRREIGGIIVAVIALFSLLFIIVAALIYCCCRYSKRTSGKEYITDGNHSRKNAPGTGNYVQENPYIITNNPDNVSMQSLQLELRDEDLNNSDEAQKWQSGTGKEMENVMLEAEHNTSGLETRIDFDEFAANTAL